MTVTQPNALFLSQTVRTIYRADPNDWAPRVGLAWDLTGSGATQFRAGYGIFYDQPFDNLWQEVSNNGVQAPAIASVPQVNYLTTPPQAVGVGRFYTSQTMFPDLTMFDPNFRNGRVQSYFYGISRGLSKGWLFEVDGSGALGETSRHDGHDQPRLYLALPGGDVPPERGGVSRRCGISRAARQFQLPGAERTWPAIARAAR